MLNLLRNNLKWILAVLLFLAIVLYGVMSPETPVPFFEEELLLSDEPDAFVVNATYTSYGNEGKLESILKTNQAKHYPRTDTGLLANPSLELYQDGELRWVAQSQQGEFDMTNDTLVLSGDVEVIGETRNGTPLTMQTNSLTYANKSSFIRTDDAVVISSPGSQLSALGMTANVEDRTVILESNVKGHYAPAQ